MEDEPKITKPGIHPTLAVGIIAVACVFGYIILDTLPSAQESNATSASHTDSSITQANANGNFALQQNCTNQLEAFQQRTDKVHNEYIQKAIDAGNIMGNPVMSIDDSSFVIGYSPSLNACVAGYRTISHDWQMPANTYAEDEEYYIVNVSTNAIIDSKGELGEWVQNPKVSSMQNDAYDGKGIAANDAARYDFFKKLNQLTEGEIGLDNNSIDAYYAQ
jgi:hypothetical protein